MGMRAARPLNSDAVGAADDDLYSAHEDDPRPNALFDSDGNRLPLDDRDPKQAGLRHEWIQSYAAHGGKLQKTPSAPQKPVAQPVADCPVKGHLIVKVTDFFDDQPIADAKVSVDGLGDKTTDKDGVADYGQVPPATYNVTARKDDYRPEPRKPVGPVNGQGVVTADKTTTVTLKLARVLRENVIFVGSEMWDRTFRTKMMFIGAAYFEAHNAAEFRAADKKTIAYVDVGYTRIEKLTLDYLRDKAGFNVIKVNSSSDIVNYINTRPVKTIGDKHGKLLLQDVSFFSHGFPSWIRLNLNSSPEINFSADELLGTDKEAFVVDGRIFSYACRTGNSSAEEHFSNDAEARPQDSLAQKMANRFQVEVHAFLTRSEYAEVLRDKDDYDRIAAILKKARETDDGKVIEIPPDHQGLPDPSLTGGWSGFFGGGAKKEGTDKYALWRKAGGIRLPKSGNTPTGLTPGSQVFTPK
jgi:hypothetical protein